MPFSTKMTAPEIDRPGLTWLNTSRPLSLRDIAGRIGILDFWTFCCINCMHVLPTLRAIEDRFGGDVAVIGVHSPKFAAERDTVNVEKAIERYDIRHPVIHDPDMILWRDYAVHAWPTLVFLSPDGHVIATVPGEPDPVSLIDGLDGLIRRLKNEPGSWEGRPVPAFVPGTATDGRLRFPGKIKACPGRDGERLWAIADAGHHQIVLADDEGKEMARYGSGQPGFADGTSASAAFRAPQGLVCDEQAIWIADTGNHALRRVDRHSGMVTTIAGSGRRGPALKGETRAAGAALASPWDLEKRGNEIFFANAGSHQIGRLSLDKGVLAPLAGTGGEDIADGDASRALLAQPSGLALNEDGALYFVDAETSSVRGVTLTGTPRVTTLVGTGLFDFGRQNGSFAQALFQHPLGLAVSGHVLFVADSYNGAVRKIDLEKRVVLDVDPGLCADPLCLPLGEPAGIAAASGDRLLLSDTNNHRIVEILPGSHRTWMA